MNQTIFVLGELIVFHSMKNKMPFLPPQQIYEQDLPKNTQSRGTSVSLQQPIVLVPKHIIFLTQ